MKVRKDTYAFTLKMRHAIKKSGFLVLCLQAVGTSPAQLSGGGVECYLSRKLTLRKRHVEQEGFVFLNVSRSFELNAIAVQGMQGLGSNTI
ncbi:hypothetical protein Mapa_003103 [Marchantia paleacea]|nr:hypothetical protein Mapa_003103 [Marchantia paleacea]